MTRIKICGLTHSDGIQAVCKAGAEAARLIRGGTPAGVNSVFVVLPYFGLTQKAARLVGRATARE